MRLGALKISNCMTLAPSLTETILGDVFVTANGPSQFLIVLCRL